MGERSKGAIDEQASAGGVAEQVRRALEAHPEIAFAVLFGSAAKEKLRPQSDIDLAVRFSPEARPDGWEYGGLLASLEGALKRRVDVVDLERTRSTVLRLEIAKGVLVKGNEEEMIATRARAYRDWRDFGPRFRRCVRAMAARLEGASK